MEKKTMEAWEGELKNTRFRKTEVKYSFEKYVWKRLANQYNQHILNTAIEFFLIGGIIGYLILKNSGWAIVGGIVLMMVVLCVDAEVEWYYECEKT